jgi:hypothetical protein
MEKMKKLTEGADAVIYMAILPTDIKKNIISI